MNRGTQLFIVSTLISRVRRYSDAAVNELLAAMDEIERKHDLNPRLSPAEEAQVAAFAARLERGETLPELELRGPIEDFLPEPQASILARLAALSEDDQDTIFAILAQCVDIDGPELTLSPAQIADGRLSIKQMDGADHT